MNFHKGGKNLDCEERQADPETNGEQRKPDAGKKSRLHPALAGPTLSIGSFYLVYQQLQLGFSVSNRAKQNKKTLQNQASTLFCWLCLYLNILPVKPAAASRMPSATHVLPLRELAKA